MAEVKGDLCGKRSPYESAHTAQLVPPDTVIMRSVWLAEGRLIPLESFVIARDHRFQIRDLRARPNSPVHGDETGGDPFGFPFAP